MKTRNEVQPNYAPLYAGALYPDLAKVFVQHGYALAVHGSLARDIDLIAVPWDKDPSTIETVIEAVNSTFAVKIVGSSTQKNHGRIAYTLALGFGECSIDLSFLQALSTPQPDNKRSTYDWTPETERLAKKVGEDIRSQPEQPERMRYVRRLVRWLNCLVGVHYITYPQGAQRTQECQRCKQLV